MKSLVSPELAISFAQKDGSMFKKALLCRTGRFDGVFGQVEVTKLRLEQLAEKYKELRANPANENDYAPILLNHMRDVDLVKGRLMADLEVAEWKEIDGVMEYGLYGTLRIDEEEAKANVEAGKYAHISISYDEDTNEILEVSFVAVEAARGSIVLSKGGKKMELEKKLSTLAQKHKALAAAVKESRTVRREALKKMLSQRAELEEKALAAAKHAKELSVKVKAAQIKAQMLGFVKEGKVEPKVVREMNFAELAQFSETALKALMASYESRPVSRDVFQHGQSADNKTAQVDLSPAKMREAMALQKSGKKALAEGDDQKDEDKPKPPPAAVAGVRGEKDEKDPSLAEDDKDTKAMDMEEWAKCLEEMGAVHAKLSEMVDKLKKLGEDTQEMAEGEDEQEKKEEEQMAEEEPGAEDKDKAKKEGDQ